jgi:hypothetical protein
MVELAENKGDGGIINLAVDLRMRGREIERGFGRREKGICKGVIRIFKISI